MNETRRNLFKKMLPFGKVKANTGSNDQDAAAIDAVGAAHEDQSIAPAACTPDELRKQLSELDDATLTALMAAAQNGGAEDQESAGGDNMALAVAAVIGLGLTASGPAHAVPSAGAIGQAVSQALKPMIDQVVGVIQGSVTSVMGDSGDKTATAVGAAGDAITKRLEQAFNKEVEQNAQPAPATCVTSTSSDVANKLAKSKAGVVPEVTKDKLNHIMKAVNQGAIIRREQLARETEFPNNEDLNAGKFLANGYAPGDEQASRKFVDRILGDINTMLTDIKGGDKTTQERIGYEHKRTKLAARASAIIDTMTSINASRTRSEDAHKVHQEALTQEKDKLPDAPDILARNSGEGGMSEMEVLNFQVDSTYASPGWSAALQTYVKPTPILKEMARMAALQNKLLLETYRDNQRAMLMSATALAADLEQQSQDVRDAYVKASSKI